MPDRVRVGLRARLTSWFRWFVFASLAVAATLTIVVQVADRRIDAEIHRHVEARLAQGLANLDVTLASARRIEGKGIEFRGLAVSTLDGEPLLFIDEVFCHCSTGLTELMTSQPAIEMFEIRRMRVQATRLESGQWNVAELFPMPRFGDKPPRAIITDSTVDIRDLSKSGEVISSLRDINIEVRPDASNGPAPVFRMSGSALGDHFSRVELSGMLDAEHGTWSAGGALHGLRMSPRLLESLPTDVSAYVEELSFLRARGELGFQVDYQPGRATPLDFAVSGSLSEGQIDDARLPYPISDLSATLYWDSHGFRVENLVGRTGQTGFQLDCHFTGPSDSFEGQLHATVQRLPLDQRLVAMLPAKMLEGWDRFQPAGVVDAELTLEVTRQGVATDLKVDCLDVSFAYERFPYRLTRGSGRVHFRNGTASSRNFIAFAGRQSLHMDWEISCPVEIEPTGWFEIKADGPVPIDSQLMNALSDKARRVLEPLNASGLITLRSGRVERLSPSDPVTRRFDLTISDGSVQYERFPLPVTKIAGDMVIVNKGWRIPDFRGSHGSSTIQCRGGWTPDGAQPDVGQLALDFDADDVGLDEPLRLAVERLSPPSSRFWQSVRPRGSIDHLGVVFRYHSATGQKSLEVTADKDLAGETRSGRTITIHPTWFPYRLDEVSGSIRLNNKGLVELKDLRGRHGNAVVQLSGTSTFDNDGNWSMSFDRLWADRVPVDHDLIGAFPPQLGAAVRKLNLTGPLNIDGQLAFAGGRHPSQARADWNLWLGVENGSIQCGARMDGIRGGVRLMGQSNANHRFTRGELELDSVTYKGTQLTQVRGPFWIDPTQAVFGAAAERDRRDQPPRQVTAAAYGGNLTFDAYVAFANDSPFNLQLTLSNADLQRIGMAMGRRQQLSGQTFAIVNLAGTRMGPHTWKGDGRVRLRDADIYELPVMVALLSFLSLRPPDTAAFTRSDIDFEIRGESVILNRIDFSGDVVSLKGNGMMDLDRNVNLSFYTLVGREEWQLPFIRSLLAEASKNILLIQVVGGMDQPEVIRRPLPELDETLQRIFQDPAANGSVFGPIRRDARSRR